MIWNRYVCVADGDEEIGPHWDPIFVVSAFISAEEKVIMYITGLLGHEQQVAMLYIRFCVWYNLYNVMKVPSQCVLSVLFKECKKRKWFKMDGLVFKIIGGAVVCVAYYKIYLQYKGFNYFNKKLFVLATLLLISIIFWMVE